MRTIVLLTIFCLSGLASLAHSQERTMLEVAQNAYAESRYDSAMAVYQALVDQGFHSFELYYNLGNSYYKMGKVPQAILLYERAKRLSPSDDDLLFNLGMVNTMITDKVEVLPGNRLLANVAETMHPDFWAMISVAAFFLFLICLFFFFYLASLSQKRTMLGVSMVAAIVSGLMFFMAYKSDNKLPEGIIFTPSLTVTSAPDASSTKLFVIHEGLKVEILESTGGHLKIRLTDGNVGWVPQESVERI